MPEPEPEGECDEKREKVDRDQREVPGNWKKLIIRTLNKRSSQIHR